MPAYHSAFNAEGQVAACTCALLPFKGSKSYPAVDGLDGEDIIDEVLRIFRAQVFFRNFEFKGAADRTSCYLVTFVSKCISECKRHKTKAEADKALFQLGNKDFSIPGDVGFVLGAFVHEPESKAEADQFKQYFKEARQEVCQRVTAKLYLEDGTQNKHWFCFEKRKFMNLNNNN